MSRRLRQVDELGVLCTKGALARAIDLAFAHFADFGPDEMVLEQLAAAIELCSPPPEVRLRFEELRAAVH